MCGQYHRLEKITSHHMGQERETRAGRKAVFRTRYFTGKLYRVLSTMDAHALAASLEKIIVILILFET
jgi:hypothetical protein